MSVAVEKNTTAEVVSIIEKSLARFPSQENRKEALAAFQKLTLPENKSEEYKQTPITRLLQRNFALDKPNAAAQSLDAKEFFIPGVEGNVIVIINGLFSVEHSVIVSPTDQVTISGLGKAVNDNHPVALAHLAKYTDVATDPFAAWNTAAWSDGVFIHVPNGKVVDKPVLVYHIHDARQGQVITAGRNLIVTGTNSEVTVIEKYDSLGSDNHFSTTITEAEVAENAGFNLYTIQNDAGNRYQWAGTNIHQERSSRVNTYTFTLAGKLVRNNLQLSLDGEGIESHMFGLYLVTNDTLADNHTVVDHRKANSFSNELYKGVMDGNSKGVFNGKIYVRPQAQKTNAFQANRNIIISDKAQVNTKPQLEIWADDVKCSHGCTTGQLDEEALFYLQARGIAKDTARAMMLYAFVGEILENVKIPELKAYLDKLVSERLHKNF
ncbi:Fe-S cluster assembly protein SufD [Chryseolinea lacunae]|uniref:Fe-S cluster assembly protein SufD n=1 Tax=Chryseolinea lacunae TaxID=2801331 RepID=A0ABS1KX67_9BACT|nr:Fe-S cluster assembly protein SufD [Chryseolinea lacunae]MBL0744063.1 Fe-S cluster assembly protein SufD [Chryseolinea lacunae]